MLVPFSAKKVFGFFIIALLLVGSWTAFCAEDSQQILKDYFDKNDKFANVAGKPLDLLNNPKYADFAQQYGRALLVVRIANEIQAAESFEGFRIAAEELGKIALKTCLPKLANALDWFGWVKTSMELFKIFVFDPMLEQMNIDAYNKTRDAGYSPEDAFAMSIRAFGHMRQKAIERFREEYGSGVFKAGSKDELLPRWETRLMQFANAWFEQQYQKYLWEKAKKELAAQKITAEGDLAALDAKLLDALNEKKEGEPVGDVEIDGKTPSPPSQHEEWNGRWKGKEKATFVTELEGAPPQIREGVFEMQVIKDGSSVRLIGYGGGGKETVLQLTPGNPNVAMIKKEWKSAMADAVSLNKETLVVFLRDGRLYMTQRLTMTITAKETVTHVTSDTIGIADRVK